MLRRYPLKTAKKTYPSVSKMVEAPPALAMFYSFELANA